MTWQTSKVQLFDVEVRIKTFMMEKLNMRWLFLWPVLKPVLVYVLKVPKSCPNIDDSYGTYLFCPQKIEKTTPKSCILMAVGSFFLCSTACPKQRRTSFPFYKSFYPTISARISEYNAHLIRNSSKKWPIYLGYSLLESCRLEYC